MNNNNDSIHFSSQEPERRPEEREEGKTPLSEREDLSGWDRMSDAKRRMIVFGALFGIVMLLVMIIAIGASCGSCGCTPPPPPSAADAVSDSQPISGADRQEPTEPEQPPVTEPVETQPTDAAPPTSTDVPEQDGGEEEQSDGAFSSCGEKADNAAGTDEGSGDAGFLGFLFGCGGCTSQCGGEACTAGLTDPVSDSDRYISGGDIDVSGGDAVMWEPQPNDEAYRELLRTKLEELTAGVIELSALDGAMSQYSDPDRVRSNDAYRALSGKLLAWCEAAQGYDAALLTGDAARNWRALSDTLAKDMRAYLDEYPELITAAAAAAENAAPTSESDTASGADTAAPVGSTAALEAAARCAQYIDRILGDIGALYDALRTQ